MVVTNPEKQSEGRRSAGMKKVEDRTKRLVTFTKRRQGLFKKAGELSELSGNKIAVFVISEQGKPYSCGDVDSIVDQYLTGKDTNSSLEMPELMRKEHKETQKEESEKQWEGKIGCWWEKSVEKVEEEWLKMYEAALVELKRNVEGELERRRRLKRNVEGELERRKNSEASTSSGCDHDHQVVIPPVDQIYYDGFIYNGQYYIEDFVALEGLEAADSQTSLTTSSATTHIITPPL